MRIAIIGGAGFIGSHVSQQLVAAGHQVRISASKPEDTARYAHLAGLAGVELVPLNLLQPDTIPPFIAGCEVVVHSGTPFQLAFGNPVKELIEPTVNGTKHLLKAVADNAGVKKLVVVASVAALNTHFPQNPPSCNGQIDESTETYFSPDDHPYAQAKYLADQLVREFVDTYTGDCELVSVCPVGVFGKALSDREDSTSVGMQHLFKNRIAPDDFVQMMYDTDLHFAVVDVRDVAAGIVEAATRTGLHGRHYLLSAESHRVSDIGRMLNGKTPLNKGITVYDAGASERDLGLTYTPAVSFLG
ncbi:dihydroflavonol 4-reductase [Lewinellaceae bacterium SD302]|nr:dihydroflavonol 4-reductase [Lewinellaceae bacterium SD302]